MTVGAKICSTSESAAVEIPIQVAQHQEIEPPIAIIVKPACACGPTGWIDTCLLGDVLKGPIGLVSIESRTAISGDIEIDETIVVEITGSHAHRVSSATDPGFFGGVLKRSVGLLVVQAIPETRVTLVWQGVRWHRIFDRSTVGQVNVEPPVVVIVKQTNPTTHRFRQILLRCW